MRATKGHGLQHALVLGLTKAVEIGATVEWLEMPTKCERCEQEAKVRPVCLTKSGFKSSENYGYDYLLCDTCFSEV